MTPDELLRRWRYGAGRVSVGRRIELWRISAADAIAADTEARLIAEGRAELSLCRNASVLARAARRGGERIFKNGADVLRALPAETIACWTKAYAAFCAEEDPDFSDPEWEARKSALARDDAERLRWKILRSLHILPSEKRARDMTAGDYLYCAANLILDGEEALRRLCPQCREQTLTPRCPCCGTVLPTENPAFSLERFEELKRNGLSEKSV